MKKIRPVILCGGSGTRLWPLSRSLYPKQFMELDGSSLFAQTLERVEDLNGISAPLIISNQEHRFLAANILHEMGYLERKAVRQPVKDRATIILEPEGRNTAPAIAVAAMSAIENGSDPLLLVLPSDHKVIDQELFSESIELAAIAAAEGQLVTFGVAPDKPETGYGYIIQGAEKAAGIYKISRFVEKPSKNTAEELLEAGNCYWNSGMFMFKASAILNELKLFAPDIFQGAKSAWENSEKDLDFIRLGENEFLQCPANSIDYAVMEHTDKAVVVPLHSGWHDLGAWESFYETSTHDAAGNSTIGDVVLLDAEKNYIHSTSRLIAGIGVKNLVVVETADAVLVMEKGRGQDVKKLLDVLKSHRREETSTHLRVYRPWGSYETLVLGLRFQVKRIIVKPGASLSLQMHHHRAEHWVVVQGTAKVQINEDEMILTENMSSYIPLGAVHRLYNPGHIDLEIIEIQSGAYLGEDDIVRFEDTYGRKQN